MKYIFGLFFSAIISPALFAQEARTFHIEELKSPTASLPLSKVDASMQALYAGYFNNGKRNAKISFIDPQFVVRSQMPDSLINYGVHSFYEGMRHAYADHRPFTLSPDMIWLLISQGFAQHVNNNAGKLRKYFVAHSGKVSLVVNATSQNDILSYSFWENSFQGFSDQIGKYTGKELMDVLTNNFSTTTAATKVASQTTIMESMKAYFEYIVLYVGCGIPDITLEGTTEDWQKIRTKAQYLKKYELGWWIDAIDPLLAQFVNASKGKVDKKFWRGMFKYHEGEGYKPSVADGWIVKFFPYDKDGHPNNLQAINSADQLPPEVTKTELKYLLVNADGSVHTETLELWAGFTGLTQNAGNYNLRPEIAWMVRKADTIDYMAMQKSNYFRKNNDNINIRVSEFPKELLSIDSIGSVSLQFTDSISIPDAISKIKIGNLSLSGKCSEEQKECIHKLLPYALLKINGDEYGRTRFAISTDSLLTNEFKSCQFQLQMINATLHIPNSYKQIPKEKYSDWDLGYQELIAWENDGYAVVINSNGQFAKQKELTLEEERQYRNKQLDEFIKRYQNEEFPPLYLRKARLKALNVDRGVLLEYPLSQSYKGKYPFCKVLRLYKEDMCTITICFYYMEKQKNNIVKLMSKDLGLLSFKDDKGLRPHQFDGEGRYYGKFEYANYPVTKEDSVLYEKEHSYTRARNAFRTGEALFASSHWLEGVQVLKAYFWNARFSLLMLAAIL